MHSFARSMAMVGALATLAACGTPRPPLLPPTDSASSTDAATDTGVGGGSDAGRCTRQEDCDDGIACTDESCVFGGVCERTTNDNRCPMGQRCFVGRGCAAGNSCMRNEDCNDNVACTRDVCGAGGVCQNIRDDSRCTAGERCSYTLNCVAPGRCGTDPDCDDGRFCNGVERCTSGMCAAGTAPNCADSDMCTGDVCNEAMRMCEHVMLNPCGGSVQAGVYDVTPAPSYTCGTGNFGPVSSLNVDVSGSNVTVRGLPVDLTGTQSMGMFSASGRWSRGICTWVFTLQGAATMANRLRMTLNVSFDFCDVSTGCVPQPYAFDGTRR
jgi:hypothetical protein